MPAEGEGSTRQRPRVLVAPDKFRGSLDALGVVEAVASAAGSSGWEVAALPMADGGEGLLDAFGGANRRSTVTGPHGRPVEAPWRHSDGVAVVESALASGLEVAGGPDVNDPVTATSRGTGELIVEAVRGGAERIVVGLGGSAMTDGGTGAVEVVLEQLGGRRPVDQGVELLVACDVETVFTDAARVFGPQKGATEAQVEELTRRLHEVRAQYEEHHGPWLEQAGVELATVPGGGAAGGLGGGLLVLGGRLVPGFELVADQLGLDQALDAVDAVVTGEGALDAQSFRGKVVGGILERALGRGLPVLVLAGSVRPGVPELPDGVTVVDLSARFGEERSWGDTAACIRRAVAQELPRLAAARR